MGIYEGFDLAPPLAAAELPQWRAFLDEVLMAYKDDPKLKVNDYSIYFDVGTVPTLLKDGTYFRRFDSKVSGSCGDAMPVLNHVTTIAKRHFGKRVKSWFDDPAVYGWSEVSALEKAAQERHTAANESQQQ